MAIKPMTPEPAWAGTNCPPGPDRVGGLAAFKAAEQLLRDTKAAGEPAGSLELAGSDPA